MFISVDAFCYDSSVLPFPFNRRHMAFMSATADFFTPFSQVTLCHAASSSSLYDASAVTATFSNPWLLYAGQQIVVPLDLKNDTNAAVELLPWHAVMLQLRRDGPTADLVQGGALSGLSHRSSSFTLVQTVTVAGFYSMKTAVVECGTVLLEYSRLSDASVVASHVPLAVAGPLVDSAVQAVIPPSHWPFNISINLYLVVPNDRENLRVQALFNQPFSLSVNSRSVWECRSIECDSGALDLGKHSSGNVIFLRLAFARVTSSSRFSLYWNAGNHPIVMDPILSHHSCSSPIIDIAGGATRVSVTGASLHAASTRLQWDPSVVLQYCSSSFPTSQQQLVQHQSFGRDTTIADTSACVPHIVSGTLISFSAIFQDSYQNFVSPDVSAMSVFLASHDSDMEASISSFGVDRTAADAFFNFFAFSIRVIRSTSEVPTSIRLRQLAQGLIATYYRDSTEFSTSVVPIIDWSSNGNFPGDTNIQIWRVKWKGFLKSPSSGAWALTISKPSSSTDTVEIQLGRFKVRLGASSSWGTSFSFSQTMYFAISLHYTHYAGSSSSGLTLSWKHEEILSAVAIPSSAFYSENWSFLSSLNLRVTPGASWSCESISPSVSFATAGLSSTFMVSAADAFGNPITELQHINLRLIQLSGCNTLSQNSCAQLAMNMDQNGVHVTLTLSGVYQLYITDSGRMDAACTSFREIYVHPASALLANSVLSILSSTIATAGIPLIFQITPRDQFSNLTPLSASFAFFSFHLFCIGPSPCCDPCVASSSTCGSSILCFQAKSSRIFEHAGALTSLSSHEFSFSLVPTQSGLFRLQVVSSKECSYCDALPTNNWDVTIKPSVHEAANLDATSTSMSVVAGDFVTISGRAFDIFGNVVAAPDPPSQIHCMVRKNRRVVSGVSSSLYLSSNFYISSIVRITTSGTLTLSMMSFRSKCLLALQHL